MTEASSRLVALYTGLAEQLGPELADKLVEFLPPTPTPELATKADLWRVETDVADLKVGLNQLSQRMDKLQHTIVTGFIAMTTAIVALTGGIVASGLLS